MRLFLASMGLEPAGLPAAFANFTDPVETIVLVTTAALHYKAENRNIIALKKRLSSFATTVQLLDVELESPAILQSADLIAIGGGNPYYLLYWLRQSGAHRIIQAAAAKGTPIFATSAGAIVLGPDLDLIDRFTPEMNTVALNDKTGLAILDQGIVPHYDRFIESGVVQEDIISNYEASSGQSVIRLKDDQAYIVNNESAGFFFHH